MCTKPIIIAKGNNRNDDITVSCGKCTECLQVRANEWALRGHFELQEHEQNCFLTLTYAENPIQLQKADMQKFIKRLRKQIAPIKIKYFSCGEYGEKNWRPHYHIIIFGYDFEDKEFIRMSQSEKPIYESHLANQLWPQGIITVQEANSATIAYSALYSTHLKQNLPNYLKEAPEFNTMSQNLGIEPILKNMETYLKTDSIWMNGFSYKIPEIILHKYIYQNQDRWDEHPQDVIDDYKERVRNYKFKTKEQNKTRARLAQKKLLYTKIKEL